MVTRSTARQQCNQDNPGAKTKLVLYFDIRNTVLVADSISNVSVEQALNSYLTGVAWGYVDEGGTWRWLTDEPRPTLVKPTKDAISYYKYAEKILVDRRPLDRVRFRKLTGDFTQTDVGRPFRPIFEQHLRLLEYPYPSHPHFCMRGSNGKMYHYILPSFFNLLSYLSDRADCYDARIVFRTYGLDAANVLQAIQSMLDGEHPAHPDAKRLSVSHHIGKMVRSERAITLHIDQHVIDDEQNIQQHMTNRKTNINAIIDDFCWWMEHGYHHTAGKPFWINPPDTNIKQIFFDDNILTNAADSIVDVRWVDRSNHIASLTLDEMGALNGKQLVQVDLLAAINHPDYYINAVNSSLQRLICSDFK